MIVLQVNQVHKSFGADEILSGVKLEVQHRDRVALVGRNGAGKSTLLKIISGEISYDSGDIIMPKDLTIGYLEQQSKLESDMTIWDEMMTIFSGFREQEQQLRHLEQQMADPAVYNDPDTNEKVMKEYDELQVDFKDAGGYQYEADTRAILHGMKFYPDDFGKKVVSLSGGQKTRLMLAKLLLSKPQLLILDEPTNHLDIETLSWLENYLKNYPGAILVVSHDRYFLDQIVTLVYEVSRHRVKKFTGNYSRYLDEKAKQYELDQKQFEKQQGEKAKLEDYVARNLVRASTTKMAQSRRKILEKTDWMEAPDGSEKSARFGFTIAKQSGNDVLNVRELKIGYSGKPVSEHINVKLYRQESLALVGPNGVGKSTLLKTIMKEIHPLEGTVHYGTGIQFGYYDQEQANLKGNKPVLNELWDDYPMINEKDIRGILGRFLFSGDDVLKPVSSLSGGEKARVALAKLMMQKANVLLLDEPTNHLDLDMREALAEALGFFDGAIVLVSHDRHLIGLVCDTFWRVADGVAQPFDGDLDAYAIWLRSRDNSNDGKSVTKPNVAKAVVAPVSAPAPAPTLKTRKANPHKLAKAETCVNDLEAQLAALDAALADPALYADGGVRAADLGKQQAALRAALETAEAELLALYETDAA